MCKKCGIKGCNSSKEKYTHYAKPVTEQAWYLTLIKDTSNVQTVATDNATEVSSITQMTMKPRTMKKSNRLHYSTFQSQNVMTVKDMRNILIIDTGTMISVVGNKELIGQIKDNQQDRVTIATNGGEFKASQ